MIRALIFDVDGTLAETEEIHREAFNEAFVACGIGWFWDQALYGKLLRTTGGRERILAHAATIGCEVDAAAIHARKTEIYNDNIRTGSIALRPGVEALIEHARRSDLALAIATTTSRANVTSLLHATLGRTRLGWFSSIRTGEDVAAKKPDPQVYRLVLDDLGLSGRDCLAFEDSENGLRAANAASIATVITPSVYSAKDDFTGAVSILPDLQSPDFWPENGLPASVRLS